MALFVSFDWFIVSRITAIRFNAITNGVWSEKERGKTFLWVFAKGNGKKMFVDGKASHKFSKTSEQFICDSLINSFFNGTCRDFNICYLSVARSGKFYWLHNFKLQIHEQNFSRLDFSETIGKCVAIKFYFKQFIEVSDLIRLGLCHPLSHSFEFRVYILKAFSNFLAYDLFTVFLYPGFKLVLIILRIKLILST